MEEMMNKELMEALDVLEKEKEISKETLFEAIENSLMTACKNHFGKADNVHVEINRETCDFLVYAEKEVVPTKDDVEDDCLQIALEDLTFVTYNKYYTLPCKSQPSKKIPEYIVILQDFVVNRIKATAFAT